jgi:2-(1,2-epoxy-1,2-dihydrophenyl)acetyl-CoA isomerase
MDYKYLQYQIESSVAFVTLNRPNVLNSFNYEMSRELQNVLDIIENDADIRAVYLTGSGRAFCAGQDLSEAISGEYSIIEIVKGHYNPVIKKLRNISKPVVAAVNGVAAGAGANIALACDIVIASEKANFIQSFSAIGLIPDSGGTYFLPRLIGTAKASALMMTGEKISAKQAEEMGMIYKCFSFEEFESEAKNITLKLASMPTLGLALTKKTLNVTFNNSLHQQLELEAELQEQAGNSYDYNEGVNAFLEKRKPVFIGK